jgi:hypothetical protein
LTWTARIPTPVAKTVIPNREVFCAHYGECLDIALDQGWRGFTCRECEAFELEELDPVSTAFEAAHCQVLKDILIHGNLARTRRKALSFYEGLSVQSNDIIM